MKLSARARRIQPSATLAMNAKTKELVGQGIDVANFSVGEPDFDTPDHVKKAAIEAIEAGFNRYTPASGIPELKKAVQQKFVRDNDLHYETNEIVICVGAKHALYNIFQVLLDAGDEVIVPAPYWVSYLEQIRAAEGTPVVIPAHEQHGFRVTAQQIEDAITPKTRALLLNSPSNPTGAVYTKAALEEIAEVCLRHQIVIVSDEIYEPFIYGGEGHISIAQLSPQVKELTLVVNGVSKSHAMTGWRIGFVAGNKDVIAAIGSLQSHSTSNPASMAQKGAVVALTESQESVVTMREQFHKRRDYVVARLNAIPGITCSTPGGAFYVFPNVSAAIGATYKGEKITDSFHLAELLLSAAHTAVVPGDAFGAPGYVRISYAASLEKLEQGLNRIATFFGELD